jgi:polynucleotide 5'-kinase involved in rRNA processing
MAVCVGVGLVRAADMQKQELYVLTPTPVEELEQVGLEELEQVGRKSRRRWVWKS